MSILATTSVTFGVDLYCMSTSSFISELIDSLFTVGMFAEKKTVWLLTCVFTHSTVGKIQSWARIDPGMNFRENLYDLPDGIQKIDGKS